MPRQHLTFPLQVPGNQRNVQLNDVGLLFGSIVHWFNISCRYSKDVGGPGTVVNSTAPRFFFRFEQNKMFFLRLLILYCKYYKLWEPIDREV